MCAEGQPLCFKHKLKTLQFGIVPGAYTRENSNSYYDTEALKEGNFPTNEEIKDNRADVFRTLNEVFD